jgi:hypothetical protein
MSVHAPVRPEQMTVPEGAAVYDADGYRLGLVESTDPEAHRFTLIRAGYPLGFLPGAFDVPAEWIRRADADRVELTVPASVLEESR